MSGSAGNIYAPSTSQTGQANTQYQTGAAQQQQAVNGYAPAVSQQAQGLTQQFINNPYQGAAQTGAGQAGAYGTGTVVPQMQQAAGAQQQAGLQALQTGFDPQNALYARQFQQMQDQQNATNSMNGVSGTPYGAGISGDASRNFNLDWLNNQQTRQNAGITAANSAFSGAQGSGTGAINTQVSASGLPASTYGQNLASDLSALSGQNTAVGGATDIGNQNLSQILSYLGYANTAQTGKQKESDSTFSSLGSALGGLGSLALFA